LEFKPFVDDTSWNISNDGRQGPEAESPLGKLSKTLVGESYVLEFMDGEGREMGVLKRST
jgi:hypothetical protein